MAKGKYSVLILTGVEVQKRLFTVEVDKKPLFTQQSLARAAELAEEFNYTNEFGPRLAVVGVPIGRHPVSRAILRAKSQSRSA